MRNYAEFVCAVGSMRIAQKEYFKTRDKKDLYRAWDAERVVDNMLNTFFTAPGSEKENHTPNGSSEQPNEPAPTQTEEHSEQTHTPTEEQSKGAPF